MTQINKFFPLGGGLDLVTPPIAVPPGRVVSCVNYESGVRGYRRIDGFERYSGKPKPSLASYYVLNFDNGVAAIASAATVTGATSGATGVTLYAATVVTGSYAGSNAAGYLVLTTVTGTFQDNENLQVAASTKSRADGTASQYGADNDTNDTTWRHAAIDYARTQIATVTGEGNILGVWLYNGVRYAFRNNVGSTAAVMWKSSTAGWAAVSLGRTVAFTSGGTYEIAEGNTITGATSAATATVGRVTLTSGTWAGGDAAGVLTLTAQTGNLQAENLNVGGNLNVATIAGNSVATTLPAGGRYEFVTHNFYGASNLKRMYGVNGVGKAFEFDGTVFTPINTGMTVDTPDHIEAHKKQLFLSFPGGSLQNSGIGTPLIWSFITGAGEIGIGEDITGLISSAAGVLAIFGRNKVCVLYGNDRTDWDLVTINDHAGAIEWTTEFIGEPFYKDDKGIRKLSATQAFGDFRMGTVTDAIAPLFLAKKKAGIEAVGSVVVKGKDQYLVFLSDGTGISVLVSRKVPEPMIFDLGKVIHCAVSCEDTDGTEVILFGSTDGYVYELNAGTSFDGTVINAYIRLAYNHCGTPDFNKRFHRIAAEVDAFGEMTLGVSAEFSYADSNQPPSQLVEFDIIGGGGFWDELTWDEFYWSSPISGVLQAYISGIGNNISVVFASAAIYETPHSIHGVHLYYSQRGMVR